MNNLSQLKKTKKKVLTFSIEEEIALKFNDLAKENGLNKSKVVEKLIFDFIKNFENKK